VLGVTIENIHPECQYTKCHYAERLLQWLSQLSILMLSVIILDVIVLNVAMPCGYVMDRWSL
jgi:hypothetical protein